MRMYGGPGRRHLQLGNGASVSEVVLFQDVAGGVNVYLAFNGTDGGQRPGARDFPSSTFGTLIRQQS